MMLAMILAILKILISCDVIMSVVCNINDDGDDHDDDDHDDQDDDDDDDQDNDYDDTVDDDDVHYRCGEVEQ